MIPISKTPIIPLNLDRNQGNDFYIMRDDLQSFSLGGNKVRIANEFLEDMKEEGADTLIMYGDVRSNLCRVLANACKLFNIPCYMVSTDVEKEEKTKATKLEHGISKESTQGANANIMSHLPVKKIPCNKNEIEKTMLWLFDTLKKEGKKPYYIYGNAKGTGREHIAANAYKKAFDQILEFEKEQGVPFDYIFHASGTGATQSGLICAKLINQTQHAIVGISISRDKKRGEEIIAQGVEEYFEKRALNIPSSYRSHIQLEEEYRLGGYGKGEEQLREYVLDLYTTHAIPFDPTYTGKAFYGMEQYIKKHKIEDKKILFIHTGGLPLFFDFIQSKGVQNVSKHRNTML